MEWVKGQLVGRGSFATVHLATAASNIIAVKSAAISQSQSLQREEQILSHLQECPEIVSCLGHDVREEAGGIVYNLFLEYVPGGSLDDLRRRSGGRIAERQVRYLAASVLRGLSFLHANGYVHCDIKPHNLLLSSPVEVKIADFGLAKRANDTASQLRGTPLYMSPEAVGRSECEAPADVWALGCTISELIGGRPAWKCSDVAGLLYRIGSREELPEIPWEASEQGKDFLSKCFVQDPAKRWTAEMLLSHPFVAGVGEAMEEQRKNKLFESPRSALEFADWNSTSSASTTPVASLNFDEEEQRRDGSANLSPAERIRKLAIGQTPPNWFSSSSSENWISVFDYQNRVAGSSEKNELILEKMISSALEWTELVTRTSSICESSESSPSSSGQEQGSTSEPGVVCRNPNVCGSPPSLLFDPNSTKDRKRRSCIGSCMKFACSNSINSCRCHHHCGVAGPFSQKLKT